MRITLPQHRAQVPAGWRWQLPVGAMSALYGGILGIGILTTISFTSFYVLLVWTLLCGNVVEGALVFGLFGLTRGAPAAMLSPYLGCPGRATAVINMLVPFHEIFGRITGWRWVSLGAMMAVLAVRAWN